MKLLQIVVIGLLFSSALLAQTTPTEVRSREWTEKDPPKNLLITNSDKYVDYLRNGEVVFRTIARTVSVTFKPSNQDNKTTHHLIEFVTDGDVFASVTLEQMSTPNWTVFSGKPVYFTTGRSGLPNDRHRFFHVCVPHSDYYEYLEISGTEVKLIPETPDSYAAGKRGFIKMTERGYLHKLGREELLDTEKKQP